MVDKTIVIILLSICTGCVLAKPYYYFHESTGETIPKAISNAPGQVQQASGQMQDAITDGTSGGQSSGITDHLGQLFNHGSSAIKGVADSVQPDLKNIGKDMVDAISIARQNVQKRIEPITQTVRPYIEHAQKAVEPYVNQAREEVPKALGKVHEQVRGAWEKLSSSAHSAPADNVAQQIQKTGEQIQHTATNAIQQSERAINQATTN